MTLRYFCCDEQRREALDNHLSLNGIDYLEVVDQNAPLESLRQQILLVSCFKSIIDVDQTGETVSLLTADNVHIEGGEIMRQIELIPFRLFGLMELVLFLILWNYLSKSKSF